MKNFITILITMKIKDLCESERPREKMMHFGPASLSDGELIAVLLRSGSRTDSALDLAQRLLAMSGGHLVELFNMPSSRMSSIPGIGAVKVASVLAAFELGKRFLAEEASVEKKPILTSRMVYDIMIPSLKGLKHEECWVLLLNDSSYLLSKVRVTSGGGRSTVIDVRQVVRLALDRSASGMILVHNHPSGNPRPSSADITQTNSLHKACNACGLELMDHVVVCDDAFFSFSEERMYPAAL